MANPTYAIQNIQSNIIAYEELKEYGFCRKAATATANAALGTLPINNAGGDVQLGTVLVSDGSKWNPISNGQATDPSTITEPVAIVIGTDELGGAVGEIDPATGNAKQLPVGDAGGMLLVNGTAIVRKQYLSQGVSGGTATIDQLAAAVEATMVQVKVYDSFEQFDGTYGDETVPQE